MENPGDSLRRAVDEAESIVRRLFPSGGQPQGFKLEMVRIIRKAELRGYEACMKHFQAEIEEREGGA